MTETKITPGLTYDFQVEEIFSFSDGSTVFVGLPSDNKIRLIPAHARILLNGNEAGQITLTEYRMPGNMTPRMPLVSRDKIDSNYLRSGKCKLVCTLMPEKDGLES